MERKIVISILSRNRILRESLARILVNKIDFEVSIDSSVSFSPLNICRTTPDVWVSDSLDCLTDSRLPRLQRQNDGTRATYLLIAMQDDASHFMAAVRAGVLGYVLQDAPATDVIAAIRSVAKGEAVCPGHLMRVLFDYLASAQSLAQGGYLSKKFGLTRRERQLVPLVGRGLTNKEIAVELNVSEQTIKSHIHRMLRKVGVANRFAISEACQGEQLTHG